MTSDKTALPRRNFLGRLVAGWTGGALLGGVGRATPARAEAQGSFVYIGEMRMFAGNFAPAGWEFCNGQLLSIFGNETLFNLIGTTYGGDGQETFALPDLRGRAPIHMGTGLDGINYVIGEYGGVEYGTLTVQQIPAHDHSGMASLASGESDDPTGRVPARNAAGVPQYAATSNATLAADALLPVGGASPHNNMQPYTGIHYIISLYGVWPSP